MDIRVRFAPSPTGPFSLGNARTALFNWLFARHEGGEFLLRIEDTDKGRSKKEYDDEILEGLKWLGLDWDEDIVRQSQRIDIYERYLKQLLEEKKAYWCFCPPETLEADYQAFLTQGFQPKYIGRCRSLDLQDVETRLKKESAVIRFHTPEVTVSFTDIVRGKVSMNSGLFGDMVIAKGLREPLYNFAVVVDDYEMQITHVIRGEDHLSNTPKQWLLGEAFEFSHPQYAHVPLILGADRKKLSKRYLDVSILDFRAKGYFPEAVLNFLVLLGWHPENDQEVLSRDEMVKGFSLKRVQKGGAICNQEKLEWFNGNYIRALPLEELMERVRPFVPPAWFEQESTFRKALILERERIKRLGDFSISAAFFFSVPDYDVSLLLWKGSDYVMIQHNLQAVRTMIATTGDQASLAVSITALAKEQGNGPVLWPLRAALSGLGASPGPFELLGALEKDESLRRLDIALEKLYSIS